MIYKIGDIIKSNGIVCSQFINKPGIIVDIQEDIKKYKIRYTGKYNTHYIQETYEEYMVLL